MYFVVHGKANIKETTPHNSVLPLKWFDSIRSDEGLTREMSALQSLFGGQFTLLTQLIKPNNLVKLLISTKAKYPYLLYG